MNYKTALVNSLVNAWPWMRISITGLIIGIFCCGFWIGINPSNKFIYLDTVTIKSNICYTVGIAVSKVVIISAIIIICLFITSSIYGVVISKIVILLLSIYLGFIFGLFVKSASNDYLAIFSVIVQEFSILWCLSIGTLKTNFVEKLILAAIPFLVLAVTNIFQCFL